MSSTDPFTGFGNATNSSVKFQIRAESGRMPAWTNRSRAVTLQIPGGEDVTQNPAGPILWETTINVLLPSSGDLQLLYGLQAQRATLRYLFGIGMRLDGTVRTYFGTPYLELASTKLVSVKTISEHRDGRAIADLTFHHWQAAT